MRPLSRPFIVRLIGTLCCELLKHMLLCNAGELKRKLEGFRQCCNAHRTHIFLNGDTPSETAGEAIGSCANLLVLVARNREKAERIRHETGNRHERFELADLSLGGAIRDLAAHWDGPLHILVNNACHPGDLNSTLSSNLSFGGHQSPEEGADTPVWRAIGSAGTETRGCYFENRRAVPCRFSKDRNRVERLFDACEAYG